MRALASSGITIGVAFLLALSATPATASLPGSTQPGATPVPPGNLIIIRDVPPRNAIIPGAGGAITAPTAPPSTVFATIEGIGQPLSDSEAASVTGSISPGQAGRDIASAVDGVLGRQSMSGAASPDRGGGSSIGVDIGGAVRSGIAPITSILGNLGVPGH